MPEEYVSSLCKTELASNGRYVRIVFERDAGINLEILIPTSQFPSVAHTVQVQADQLPSKPAKRSLLGPGQSLATDGFQLSPGSSGEFVLTVFARIFGAEDERGISIPIPLTPSAAQALREKLDRALSSTDIG